MCETILSDKYLQRPTREEGRNI